MTKNDKLNPQYGEIWRADLDPTVGEEIQKLRRVVVISQNQFNKKGVRVVVPLTTWQERFARMLWHVPIKKTPFNNLKNDSSANILQIRSISIERFKKYAGEMEKSLLEEIKESIAVVLDIQ